MSSTDPRGPVEDDVAGLQAALDAEADEVDHTVRDEHEAAGDEAPAQDVGDLAADYIEELLDICDLDGDIEILDERGRTTVKVSGGDLRLLAAPATVGALQELTRLAVQTRTGDFARVTLDIGGSRDQRSRELGGFVEAAAKAFESGGTEYALVPMSSYERKIVHDLAAERGIASHSEGEGSDRHIVLTPVSV